MEIQTKLNWEKFKPFFGTWADKIKPFFDSGGFNPIYEYLKKEGQRGVKIAPLSSLAYRAFQETDISNLKVVLISFCPYHSFINGSSIADGLAFSCSITGKQQPSLSKFIQGIEIDIYNGLNLNYNKNMTDLTPLAKEGVLLLNSSLTVSKGKPGSHQTIWMPFTKYVLEHCLAYTGVPIVFIGKDAQIYEKCVSPLTHGHIFKLEHPAFAARMDQDWDTKGVFKVISRIVKENTGKEIDWLNEKPPF